MDFSVVVEPQQHCMLSRLVSSDFFGTITAAREFCTWHPTCGGQTAVYRATARQGIVAELDVLLRVVAAWCAAVIKLGKTMVTYDCSEDVALALELRSWQLNSSIVVCERSREAHDPHYVAQAGML